MVCGRGVGADVRKGTERTKCPTRQKWRAASPAEGSRPVVAKSRDWTQVVLVSQIGSIDGPSLHQLDALRISRGAALQLDSLSTGRGASVRSISSGPCHHSFSQTSAVQEQRVVPGKCFPESVEETIYRRQGRGQP